MKCFLSSGKSKEELSQWIDGDWDNKIIPNITARLPQYIPNPRNDWERSINEYRAKGNKHMAHKCAVAENGCKKTPLAKCKRGYESTTVHPHTTFDERGFAVHRRDNEETDLKIVPHNPLILMDWDGHCNVEWAAGPKSVLYLYSYLFKGAKSYF
jgi:hypothetical protein